MDKQDLLILIDAYKRKLSDKDSKLVQVSNLINETKMDPDLRQQILDIIQLNDDKTSKKRKGNYMLEEEPPLKKRVDDNRFPINAIVNTEEYACPNCSSTYQGQAKFARSNLRKHCLQKCKTKIMTEKEFRVLYPPFKRMNK